MMGAAGAACAPEREGMADVGFFSHAIRLSRYCTRGICSPDDGDCGCGCAKLDGAPPEPPKVPHIFELGGMELGAAVPSLPPPQKSAVGVWPNP
jgi:hypothetical protein